MYCNNCGAQIPDGARFCNNCGVILSRGDDSNSATQVQSSTAAKNYSYLNMLGYEGQGNYSQKAQIPQKKKSHWFLKLVLILLVVVVAFSVWVLYSLDLYVYTRTMFKGEDVSAQTRRDIEETFQRTYLFNDDGDYLVIDPESGLGFYGSDLHDDSFDADIECQGNYAFITFRSSGSSGEIIVSYYRASLTERFYFASHYYTWN